MICLRVYTVNSGGKRIFWLIKTLILSFSWQTPQRSSPDLQRFLLGFWVLLMLICLEGDIPLWHHQGHPDSARTLSKEGSSCFESSFFKKNTGSSHLHEYLCRSRQPLTDDQKVQLTDDLSKVLISVATNCFHPISSLMFLFKVFSLCLLSDSTDPNVTANSKQVSLLGGFYVVTWFKCLLHYSQRSCKMTQTGTKTQRKRCRLLELPGVCCNSPPQWPAGEESEQQRLQWLLSQTCLKNP